MRILSAFIICLAIVSCKKETVNSTAHSITLKCLGSNTNTIVYNFGDSDIVFKGTIVTSWTVVRDIKVGKVVTLKQTADTPGPKAVTVTILDGESKVAYMQSDTTASVTYTVR
ncbi:MAG: hypothetical protein JNL63_01465 [Bacteroidia bacterium]|nr:hypothetical protein [Bacteroidia bacterium]